MRSVITPQQHFTRVANPKIERSTFDRSHGHKTTFDAGILIPIFVDEALPGDTFNLKTSIFGRLSTPLKPIMDNIYIDVHYFSVPIRLVWENWKRFNGEQDNPDDTTNFLMPVVQQRATGFGIGTLADYFGLPTQVQGLEKPLEVRADFFRAYNLIWNEWYRDQNLQDSVTVEKGDGPDLDTNYFLLPRGKRKDYFTSALPWAQKAQPVSIPLGDFASLTSHSLVNDGTMPTASSIDGTPQLQNIGFQASQINSLIANSLFTKGNPNHETIASRPARWENTGLKIPDDTKVDLSTASTVTINALREAFQIQKMYERDARGGTRYTEVIRSHFGVISPDARQQRPEFLGGFTMNVSINPIAQTSSSQEGSTPQGNLAGMGTFASHNKGFVKSFTEHEVIIGLMSARADLNYQNGINRMWSRSTRFDFYWPALSHLGEQAILNKEIFAQGLDVDDEVFGYQERYAEYRYKPSLVTGLFRSSAPASLDSWHLAQDFETLPALNEHFIVEAPPIDRIVAVPSEPEFMADIFFDLKCARPMPTYATPGLMDHF